MGCAHATGAATPGSADQPPLEQPPVAEEALPPAKVYSRVGLSSFLAKLYVTPDLAHTYRPLGSPRVIELVESAERQQARAGLMRSTRIRAAENIHDAYDVSPHVLGHGAFGVVMWARSFITEQDVAVKVIPTDELSDDKFALLFSEVENCLHMDHPNICRVFEVYEDESQLQLVMEYCGGQCLYDRLASDGKFSERQAASTCKQMMEAIHYIHSHNVCHRDLKLENWVYTNACPKETLKLIDFGFSRVLEMGSRMTAVLGSCYYVAPEVLNGPYDYRCDLWSLGVVAYMLLTGSPPYQGDSDEEVLGRVRQGSQGYLLTDSWLCLPPEAQEFVGQLLREDPDDRRPAREMLKHGWLECSPKLVLEVDRGILLNIRKFAEWSCVKRTVLALIASHFSVKGEAGLMDQFQQFDYLRNGSITREELVDVLERELHVSEEEAAGIFSRLDCLGEHEIPYTEFLAAAVAEKELLQERYLRQAFQWFDHDHDGFIGAGDLASVLGDDADGQSPEELVREIDLSEQGKIGFDDWCTHLLRDTPPASLSTAASTPSGSPRGSPVPMSPEIGPEDIGVEVSPFSSPIARRMHAYAPSSLPGLA